MRPQTFVALQEWAHSQVGIVLDNRESMVNSRLRSLAKQHSYADVDSFVQEVLSKQSPDMVSQVVDRLSTNHTYFHREASHFEQFQLEMKGLIAHRRLQGRHDLRVWCAAASMGQEPYTLALLLRELLGSEADTWKAGLLASDISQDALRIAKEGIYSAEDIQRLPAAWRKWFLPLADGRSQARPELRRDVTYRRLNLVKGPFHFREPFDVIFCRNVMIYFDLPTRIRLIGELAVNLRPGGVLFISLSETLPKGHGLPFRYESPGVYRRTP